ncbi:MAG: zinc dependent phospholipase C family protein [Desulfatibacillaceae bacterium]
MPKEITHWVLAERVAEKLPPGFAQSTIRKHFHLYLLGSVALDTPFYTLVGRYTETFTTLAERLHSRWGEDSFEPVRDVLEHYGNQVSDAAWAFLFGLLTHIMADAVHHPVVMYYSGCPHDMPPGLKTSSLCRHRILEGYLDLYHLKQRPHAAKWTFLSLLRRKEIGSVDFYRLMSVLYFGRPGVYFPHVRMAFASHALFHRIFQKRHLFPLIRHGNRVMGGKWWHVEALFNPNGKKEIARGLYSAPIPYRHPVTGRRDEKTMEQLARRSVASSLSLILQVERGLEAGDVADYFASVRGPSPENGLVGVPTREMAYHDLETNLSEIMGVEPRLCDE